MQNRTELANTPIQKNYFSLFFKNVCSTIAQFFECDQRFQQLEIVPYQVYYLRDQNTLLTESARQQINRDSEDSRVIYNESSRWDKFSTWKAWQFWFCCHRQQNVWLDEGTEYDPREIRIVNQEKLQGYFQNDCQKQDKRHDTVSEKSIIIIQDDSEFDKNENKDSSILSDVDYSSILKLNPHEQKVRSKQTELKSNNKKSKQEVKNLDLSNIVPDQTKAECNDQLNKLKKINNKTEIKPQFNNNKQEYSQNYFLSNVQNTNSINQTQQHTSFQQLKKQQYPKNKHINHNLNAQDDFNQLGQAISIQQQQKQIKHSKTANIKSKVVSSNIVNFNNEEIQYDSEIIFSKQKPKFFQQKNNNTQPIFKNSESLQQDDFIKKRKKMRNIFNEDTPIEGVQIMQNQQALTDLVKKRKRRNRLIINQQKDKQTRANKRQQQQKQKQKQQLQIIIYSNSQGDD